MIKYVIAVMAAIIIGISAFSFYQRTTITELNSENVTLERNLKVKQSEIENARLAIDVADAYTKRAQERQSELSAEIEKILNTKLGGCADEAIDPRLLSISR
jgi:uncharacterized protein HemX